MFKLISDDLEQILKSKKPVNVIVVENDYVFVLEIKIWKEKKYIYKTFFLNKLCLVSDAHFAFSFPKHSISATIRQMRDSNKKCQKSGRVWIAFKMKKEERKAAMLIHFLLCDFGFEDQLTSIKRAVEQQSWQTTLGHTVTSFDFFVFFINIKFNLPISKWVLVNVDEHITRDLPRFQHKWLRFEFIDLSQQMDDPSAVVRYVSTFKKFEMVVFFFSLLFFSLLFSSLARLFSSLVLFITAHLGSLPQ